MAAVVIAVDQVTKSLAVEHLAHGPVHLIGPLDLALGYNTGSAFSLFTGWAPVLAVLSAALALVLGWAAWRARQTWMAVSLGLVLGGALGNVADRILRGHHGGVVDFISLRFWPTFNVADACIVVGLATLAFQLVHRAR